jgi:membrane protein implicated in regulation of membrane protease activity
MNNKRRAPPGDILSLVFLVAVGLMWVFADSINANPITLLILTVLALLLIINMLAARKRRRKIDQTLRDVEKLRKHIGDTDDTDERDKYYF